MSTPNGSRSARTSIIMSRSTSNYYSVPYQLRGRELDVRVTAHTVEGYHKGQRVASHARSQEKGRHTTVLAHMPKAHQAYAEWTPDRIAHWTGQAGPSTRRLVEEIMADRPHPEQGFRSCMGIMRLGKIYTAPSGWNRPVPGLFA